MEPLPLKELDFGLQRPTGPSSGVVTFKLFGLPGLECLGVSLAELCATYLEAMFFHFKNPLFPFCLFANSTSYTKLPNSPDFTGFYWSLADSTKIF